MTDNLYSKQDILEIVKRYGGLEYPLEKTTLEKRLNDVITFLKKDRVQDKIRITNLGIYFNEMNFRKAKSEIFKGSSYNIYDALFLSVLVALYENKYFKKIRNPSGIKDADGEADIWIEEVNLKLDAFEPEWNKKDNIYKEQLPWGLLKEHLMSLYYTITLVENVSYYSQKTQGLLNNKIDLIIEEFEKLPDKHKEIVYDSLLKNRLDYILKELKSYPSKLREKHTEISKEIVYKNIDGKAIRVEEKIGDIEADYIEAYARLEAIDKEIERGDLSDCTLVKKFFK